MILRRLSQHIKDQNWFAVALDFVIVVVGVFLGIQIGNWNTDLALNRKAHNLEHQLVFEMANEALSFRAFRIYYDDVQANGEAVLADLTSINTLSDEDFIIKAFRATQFKKYIYRRYAFDDIVEAGITDRIKDQKLFSEADKFYKLKWQDDAERESRESSFRRLFRETVPLAIQRDAALNCGDPLLGIDSYAAATQFYEPDFSILLYSCSLSVSAEQIKLAALALRDVQGLEPALRAHMIDMDTTNKAIAFFDERLTPWRMTPEQFEKALKERAAL